VLQPLEHHDLLVFWVQLAVLIGAARLLGTGARRIGLPSVVGELGAGVLLGPTVFGRVWPSGFEWFLPDHEVSSGLLLGVAWIGIALLLISTGFETDLALIGRLGRSASLVSIVSIVVPLAAGLAVGAAIPEAYFGEEGTRLTFTLFIGVALAVSSLAVIAKILSELGFMRRDFGQITVAAGMANDVVGWLLLGTISAVAASGTVQVGDVALTLAGMAAFIALALTVGQSTVDRALRHVRRGGENVLGAITVIGMTALVFAVVTQWIGVEGVLGAFVAGVVVGRSRFHQEEAEAVLDSVTAALLAPVFFATAGLRVDLGLLVDEGAVGWALLVLVVAVVAKFVGAAGGAVLAGRTSREAVALGAGLNARGTLELVIATVGLSLGVLSDVAYTIVVLVPLVTSVVASAGVRMAVRGWEGTTDEQERLAREENLARNVLVKAERALLPTRGGSNSIVAAQVLQYAWPHESAITILALEDEEIPEVDAAPLVNVFHDRDVEIHRVPYDEAYEHVPHHSRLGYGIVALALPDRNDGPEAPLTPLAAQLIGTIDLPLVLVRKARNLDGKLPAAFTRALVPVAGGRSARAAQELAFGMAGELGTEIVLAHVVARGPERIFAGIRRREAPRERSPHADRLMDQALAHAGGLGLEPRTVIRRSTSTGEELVRTAREVDADLVVLGASARQVDHHTFLGHTAEQVLDECDATVVVVVSPPEA